jgi:hypothetical protein
VTEPVTEPRVIHVWASTEFRIDGDRVELWVDGQLRDVHRCDRVTLSRFVDGEIGEIVLMDAL